MPTDRQTARPPHDREEISKAREAAEALFRPNSQAARAGAPIAPTDVSTAERQPPRKPRIIATPPTMPGRDQKPEVPATPRPQPHRTLTRRGVAKIPASDYGRIRALATYGLTLEQVAELYDVPVDEIERIATQR